MQLTKNFPLEDMLESQIARRYNIQEQFNPPKEVIDNLKQLCEKVLQPIRDKVGVINISSGYRANRTNKIARGSATSQHMTGEAVDIYANAISNKELFDIIKNSGLDYDQLIWEYGTKNNPAWVHVSYTSKRKNRKQVLYIGI